jgi:hypothetical protein
VWTVATDANGIQESQACTPGIPAVDYDNNFVSDVTAGGGAVTARVWGATGEEAQAVILLGPDGSLKNYWLITDEGGSQLYGAAAAADGGMVAAGRRRGDGDEGAWLVGLAGDTRVLWRKAVIPGASEDDRLLGITPYGDGHFSAGFTEVGNVYDLLGVMSGPGGDILWTVVMGGSGHDAAMDVAATRDGGLVTVGATTSTDRDLAGRTAASDDDADGWIVKFAPAAQ